MAEVLYSAVTRNNHNRIVIGNKILEIITSGMYNEPKMVLREYIQNASDAIDDAINAKLMCAEEARIRISINGLERSIVIEDNGIGIKNKSVKQTLCSIAFSLKTNLNSRGFRGIGRLAGLGYCETIRFETKTVNDKKIAIVTWDGNVLERIIAEEGNSRSIEEAIHESTKIEYVQLSPGYQSHFFRVTLLNVKRFHKDELMNVKDVRNYISQAAPIDFSEERFPYAKLINNHLNKIKGYKNYRIEINGQAIFKPHELVMHFKDGKSDVIKDIRFVEFKGKSGNIIASGWYALTNFMASLPKDALMRGIKVRQGNIAIGDERFLDSIFTEQRFALWHVGEIHVDYSIKLNARRDGFEQSREAEPFFEQLNVLGKKLSRICRNASLSRNRRLSTLKRLSRMSQEFTAPVFIDKSHKEKKITSALGHLRAISEEQEYCDDKEIGKSVETIIAKIREIEQRNGCVITNYLDGRKYRHLSKKDIFMIMLNNVFESYNTSRSSEELVLKSIRQFLKKEWLNGKRHC